jgi:hypothetical protein
MKLAKPVEHCLGKLIQENLFEVHTGTVEVTETAKEGWAQVTCRLPPEAVCIRWKIEKLPFNFLKDAKRAADGALLVQMPDGRFEAHVMECKRTIHLDSWNEAKIQLRWSLARVRALAGVLGVPIEGAFCYTAYREETFSTNPGLAKVTIGDRFSEDRLSEEFRAQFDWPDAEINLGHYPSRWPHRRVQLDPQGQGVIDLSP